MSKKIKTETAINSDAYKFLMSFIGPRLKVVDLYVRGKWLTAEVTNIPAKMREGSWPTTSFKFSVRNNSI